MNIQFIAHRINTIEELNKIPIEYGIELDIRDQNGKLILVHDPFKNGTDFEEFLQHYKHSFIILNIKSERIEYRVLELLQKYKITEYFFLDSSFPMIYQLSKNGEKNIALRFSEYESLESILMMKNKVKWVWVDCFTKFPLDSKSYNILQNYGFKICLVSPELQSHSIEWINKYCDDLKQKNIIPDMICTKVYNIEKWKL